SPQDHRHRNDEQHKDVCQCDIPDEIANPRRRFHAANSSRLAVREPMIRKSSSTANEIASSTMDIAAAPVRSSFSIKVRIHCDDTSVFPGTAPPISTTEPNSPIARENASPAPDNNAGVSDGNTTEVNTFGPEAPSDAAASSVSRSISSSTGWTARTTNGS